PRAIMVSRNRLDVVRDDVRAHMRRDVADPKPSLRIRRIFVRQLRAEQRLLEARREFPVLFVDLARRYAGHAHHAKKQVLERDNGMLAVPDRQFVMPRSEEHTSELQSRGHLVCRLLLEKKK